MLVWILNHDIILIGCTLGLMCGIMAKILMTLTGAIVDIIEENKNDNE